MNPRELIEEFEAASLAPYAARSRESRGRAVEEKKHPYRTEFQRDRDRIIHSTAFRRLQAKTQVYIEHEGDYFRTRLTHTMETAQIARTISRALKLNEDLAETLALAHDLGHPPFGHAGEMALAECMANYGGFEHNWQGIRIVEKLENKYDEFEGLNLTWEVRESMRKHTIRPDISIEAEFWPEKSPLLECKVADIADYIAYCSHDLDDAVKAGLLRAEDIESLEIWNTVKKIYQERLFTRKAVRLIIDIAVSDLIDHTSSMLKEHKIFTVDDVRNTRENIVSFSPRIERQIEELYDYLMANVYKHHKVEIMAHKGKRFVRQLFQTYMENPRQLPEQFQKNISEDGQAKVVCDYIAGMTDRYAQNEIRKLFYPFETIL